MNKSLSHQSRVKKCHCKVTFKCLSDMRKVVNQSYDVCDILHAIYGLSSTEFWANKKLFLLLFDDSNKNCQRFSFDNN